MIAATLFSGIGAPETAMPHWYWPWHAEIEKFLSAVMAARHPGSINLGDVTADDFCERTAAIARPDIIVFGSPCQSYSIAGRRLGLDDPRGNLALVALGIVARLAPRWFVFENVPGLLSSSNGSDFGIFLRTVDELGYSGAWASLDAQHFGLAQRRERLFFVGHSGDWRYPAAVLFEPEGLCGDSPPRHQARQEIAGAIGAGSARSGQRVGRREAAAGQLVAGTITSAMGRRCGQPNDDNPADYLVAHALNAHGGSGRADGESETFVTHALRAGGFDASEDGTGRGTPLIAFDTTQITPKTNRCQPQAGDPCHPIPAHGHAPAISICMGSDPIYAHDLAMPQTQRNGDPGTIQAGAAVRRLTPRECERLQGFPDDYTHIEYRGKPASGGPRYKALGNSMAVPVLRWILARIEFLDQHFEAAA